MLSIVRQVRFPLWLKLESVTRLFLLNARLTFFFFILSFSRTQMTRHLSRFKSITVFSPQLYSSILLYKICPISLCRRDKVVVYYIYTFSLYIPKLQMSLNLSLSSVIKVGYLFHLYILAQYKCYQSFLNCIRVPLFQEK